MSVPHHLMMSATPIPRTLAMTYYADLDVSVIGELPPGRTPIVTRVVDQSRRDEVIANIHADAQAGRQAYWVCPLIEESEALQLQTATDTYAMLTAALPDLRVGLIHGRLKTAEKQDVMEAFAKGEIRFAGGDNRDRSRCRCAECLADGDRTCRAFRPLAIAPVTRTRRTRCGSQRVSVACIRVRWATPRVSA